MNPAFVSTIACGAAGGLLFHSLRVPGGAMPAADMGDHAPAVMAFQVTRLYTVILLAPLLSYLLHVFCATAIRKRGVWPVRSPLLPAP